MSDLSRREFIKNGAIGVAGIAVAGSAANIITGVANADSAKHTPAGYYSAKMIDCTNFPPPERVGNDIVCPSDDPDFDRLYAALIRQTLQTVGGVTTVVAEEELLTGSYDDPFNGSSFTEAPSANHRYICRMIRTAEECDSNPISLYSFLSTPAVSVERTKIRNTLPRPPSPQLPVSSFQKEIWIPKWRYNPPTDPNDPNFGVTMLWSRLKRVEADRTTHGWKRSLGGGGGTGINTGPAKILAEAKSPDTIFTGKFVPDFARDSLTEYFYYTEVGYRLPEETPQRLRRQVMGCTPHKIPSLKT